MNAKILMIVAMMATCALMVKADCQDRIYSCKDTNNNEVGTVCGPSCYSVLKFSCLPCDGRDYAKLCADHGLTETHFTVETDKVCKQI